MEAQNIRIELNSRLTVELLDTSGESERREFSLVTTKQADFRSGLLDENTPLGRALRGYCAGETVPYTLGDLKEVRILSVESGEESVPSDAAEKRRAAVRQAEAQSEITSQMIFATASGSKWGDYGSHISGYHYDVEVDKLLKEDDE